MLDPNNADSYYRQAEVLILAGRPEESLRSIDQAMRLNPRYPPWYLVQAGFAYNLTGRYEEAITALEDPPPAGPKFYDCLRSPGYQLPGQWFYQQSPDPQMLEQALAAAQRGVVLNDALPGGHSMLGYVIYTKSSMSRLSLRWSGSLPSIQTRLAAMQVWL